MKQRNIAVVGIGATGTVLVADACFQEALPIAKSMGYDFGPDFLKQALAYLPQVGVHRDSMCFDIDNKAPTEIDFF